MGSALSAKRLELLKEAVPRMSRVLVLSYLEDPIAAPQLKELNAAAGALGVKLLIQDVRTADDLPTAFGAGAKGHAEGLLTTVESIFVVHRKRVVELAAQHRLPGLYPYRLVVDAGGLMAYDAFKPLLVRTATQGGQACRLAGPAARQARARNQPQDGEGPRPQDPALAAGAGGSGDRVMDRRRFLLTSLAGALGAPLDAGAQQTGKVPRIGQCGI